MNPIIAMAEALESAAAIMLLEEVEYSLGLADDHLFNFTFNPAIPAFYADGKPILNDRNEQVMVEQPDLPQEVGEALLADALAAHRATASLLLVQARRLRDTLCGHGPLLTREEDLAMRDQRVPNHCVQERDHEGPHSARTPEQVAEVVAKVNLWKIQRRHGITPDAA